MSIFYSLDKGWRFSEVQRPVQGIDGSYPAFIEDPACDDSAWRVVNLPHDAAIETPPEDAPYTSYANHNTGLNGYYHGGLVNYRRHLVISDLSKEYLLQFDGAYRKSEVWVNGCYVGGEANGYFSFVLDITPYVQMGDNVIAVRCDNLDTPNCRWYTGLGLYRHVWLVERERIHMAHWGTAITTPNVARDEALVHIVSRLEGTDGMTELACDLLDSSGSVVASGQVRTPVRGGNGTGELDLRIPHPALWSCHSPNLYTARLHLSQGGVVRDENQIVFGIRKLEFRPGAGFLLNDEPTKFKGVCIHHDAGPLGAAVPENVWESRLRKLKAIGCNAIRTSHNPPAPELLDLCDRLGLLVMDELCDKWEPPHYLNFHENWRRDIDRWVDRDRNHPCIVMWSVGNENYPPDEKYLLSRFRMLCDQVRRADPSRIAMAAAVRGEDEPAGEAARKQLTMRGITGLVGINYGEQWYSAMLEQDPNLLILGTENYLYLHSTVEDRDAMVESCGWLDCEADPRVMGCFLWTGIDYLGEAWHAWPRNGSVNALMDVTNFIRPVGDFYHTLWEKDTPLVYLDIYRMDLDAPQWAHMWDIPRMDRIYQSDSEIISVATYTNCEEVELLLNGKSLGVQKLSDHPNHILNWTFRYAPGTLTALARNGGVVAAECTRMTPGMPDRLSLSPTSAGIRANEYDVAYVETTLVDRQGRECHWAEGTPVTFTVEGPGEVYRVGNGLLNATHPYLGHVARVGNDRCCALVRAHAPGNITVRAQCGAFTGELVLTGIAADTGGRSGPMFAE